MYIIYIFAYVCDKIEGNFYDSIIRIIGWIACGKGERKMYVELL